MFKTKKAENENRKKYLINSGNEDLSGLLANYTYIDLNQM